jgi:hypothetical protein
MARQLGLYREARQAEGSLHMKEELQRCIEAASRGLTSDAYVCPSDLCAVFGEGQARQMSQHLVARYGGLLRWWPTIVSAATEARCAGHRLARRIRRAN